MSRLGERLDKIKEIISQPDFLANRGLSNEIGFHIFCYPAEEEPAVQEYLRRITAEKDLPFRVLHFDLYELFLAILEKKRILDKIPDMEIKWGNEKLLEKLKQAASPESFIAEMDVPRTPERDVLFISGVGKAYPFIRAHRLLESMQAKFSDLPVVLFYPGKYDGKSLSLFNEFGDGNYYRAFNLLD